MAAERGEGVIQVALDGAGKKTKQYILKSVPQPDGTYADVYVTCAAIVDSHGSAVNFDNVEHLLRRLLEEVRILRSAFSRAFEEGALGRDIEEENLGDAGNDPDGIPG